MTAARVGKATPASPGRSLLALAGGWTALGFVSAAMPLLGDSMLVDFRLRIGWMSVGLPLLLICFNFAMWGEARSTALGVGAFVLGTMLAAGPIWSWILVTVDHARVQASFRSNRPHYEAIIRRLEAEPPTQEGRFTWEGVEYEVEPGRPLRVTFPIVGGLLDNRRAVVYDESEAVGRLKDRDYAVQEEREDPGSWRLRMLFGGVIWKVRRLGDRFYYCLFT